MERWLNPFTACPLPTPGPIAAAFAAARMLPLPCCNSSTAPVARVRVEGGTGRERSWVCCWARRNLSRLGRRWRRLSRWQIWLLRWVILLSSQCHRLPMAVREYSHLFFTLLYLCVCVCVCILSNPHLMYGAFRRRPCSWFLRYYTVTYILSNRELLYYMHIYIIIDLKCDNSTLYHHTPTTEHSSPHTVYFHPLKTEQPPDCC